MRKTTERDRNSGRSGLATGLEKKKSGNEIEKGDMVKAK